MDAFRSWGRYVLGAAVSLAVGLVAFVWKQPVPGLDQFDLGIHELGHLLAGFMPRMFMFLAGSALQILVPLGLGAYFLLRRKEWASAGFCLAWAGTSARDVAVYVADAPVQALPLIGGGTHDWAYLLGPQGFDSISSAGAIARGVEVTGMLLVAGGLGVCLWPVLSRLWAPKPGFAARIPKAAKAPAPAPGRVPAPAALPAADPAGDPWLAAARLPFHAGAAERSPGDGAPGMSGGIGPG